MRLVSRENAVIAAYAVLALVTALGGHALTGFDDTLLPGVLVLLGVIVPQLLDGCPD